MLVDLDLDLDLGQRHAAVPWCGQQSKLAFGIAAAQQRQLVARKRSSARPQRVLPRLRQAIPRAWPPDRRRRSALALRERPRARELRPGAVGTLGELEQLARVGRGLDAVAGHLGGARRAAVVAEAIGLALLRRLVLGERRGRLLELDEHVAEQLARRHDAPRRDDVLLVAILEVGRGAHEAQRLVALA